MIHDRAPSVEKSAFSCPHCGTFTSHYWHKVFPQRYPDSHRVPKISQAGDRNSIAANTKIGDTVRQRLLVEFDAIAACQPVIRLIGGQIAVTQWIDNLFISECFQCHQLSIWLHRRLIHPAGRSGPPPSPDLPADIARDFEEARSIVAISPRGAAALLRLVIQKLCIYLGEKGQKIDDDIASLIAKGLDPVIGQALDVVRVIGNEAVHPGTLDLRDDAETAQRLFGLVNHICQQLISHPKAVQELYDMIPSEKRKGIENRNKKALTKPSK